MEALQYANQFASLQNGQLLELRETIRVMHQAAIEQQLTEQDAEAKRQAAVEAAFAGEHEPVRVPTYRGFTRR